MRNLLHRTVLVLSLILVTAAAVTAQAPRYELTVLEPIVLPEGDELPVWISWDINNAGQVAGEANTRTCYNYKSVGFRYTPGIGMEIIDPTGERKSHAKKINENGQVFGFTRKGVCDPLRLIHQDSIFLYSDDEFDFLEKGSSTHLVWNFWITDMNEAGDIVGIVDHPNHALWKGYLYTSRDGWQDLVDLHPRLRSRKGAGVSPRQINNAGDMTITISPPGGFQESYIFLGGETLIPLDDFGGRVNVPAAINEAGQIAGLSRTTDMKDLAYVYSPGVGLTKIHPKRFYLSGAGWINSEGVASGFLKKRGEPYHYLFTYDERRSQKMKVVARKADFRALFTERVELGAVSLYDVNEELEMVGGVWGRNAAGEKVWILFYFSPETGVLNLSELYEPVEQGTTLFSVNQINDRGDILVNVRTEDNDFLDAVLYKIDG